MDGLERTLARVGELRRKQVQTGAASVEIARRVRQLMAPSADNPKGMSKGDVAQLLGYSQGQITRYVVFGDDALQAKWVTPGYVNTVELLYQITLLPTVVQEQLYGRLVSGAESSPVSSKVVRSYKGAAVGAAKELKELQAQERRIADLRRTVKKETQSVARQWRAETDLVNVTERSVVSSEDASPPTVSRVRKQRLAADGDAGKRKGKAKQAMMSLARPPVVKRPPVPALDDEYSLSERDAQLLRGGLSAEAVTGSVSSDEGYALPNDFAQLLRADTLARATTQTVRCRLSMRVIAKLLAVYGKQVRGLADVAVDVQLPEKVAARLLGAVTGEKLETGFGEAQLAKALKRIGG